MTYSTNTRLDSKPQGGWSADAWYEAAVKRGAKRLPEVRAILDTYYGQSFVNADILACQFMHETGWATSYWFETRLNVAGIGITGDPAQNNASKTWTNGRDAARAHLTHVWLYARGTTLPDGFPGSRAEDPRWDAAVAAGYAGTKPTIGSLTNTWAIDSRYGEKLVAILNQRPATETPDAGDGDNEQEAPMAGYQKVRFVGLDRDVYLPDHIKVSIEIVGTDKCGWVRSCQSFSGQTRSTFHDTGSPGSRARSERNYLHSGPRDGSGNRRLVGYNFAVDDTEIIQLTPLNEVTWAAGTPEGNRYGWHVEMCFGGSIDFERSLSNAIALHAGLIAAKGWNPDTALVKHQDWSGKWCPAQILNRGRWPEVQRRVGDGVRAINAGVEPGEVLDIAVGAFVATTVSLNVRDAATTSGSILTTASPGVEFEVIDGPQTADGHTWWQLKGDVTGWASDGVTGMPYLVVTKPAPDEEEPEEPAYAKPLAIAELAPYVGRPITPMPATIALESGIAVPVFDRVRAVKATPRMQTGDGAASVGPDLKPGEEFDVSFLVIGDGDLAPYWVTSWWTRIRADDCEVISDAPKDIPAAAPEAA